MELLVSLAVLVVVATPLLGLVTLGAQTQLRARRYTAAVYLAREALETARSQGYCGVSEQTGEPVAGSSEFVYDVAVSAPVNWGELDLKEVRVTVAWQEQGIRQQVGLATYLARR
jgi:type II secretory pathway pseudopilin PulG